MTTKENNTDNFRRCEMKSSIKDLPATFQAPHGTLRQVEWGGMTVELGDIRKTADSAPLFKGLPDDRCQCPHWGYVLNGRLHLKFADHEEVYNAGEVYYAPPGHTPLAEAGCEYLAFSPTDQMREIMAVLKRNLQAMQPAERSG
jgi:hypothetical protein